MSASTLQEPMLTAVGRGIQSFASVERHTAQLYAALMYPAPEMLSLLVVDAARHIETKLRMTSAAAEARLEGKPLERFRGLMKEVKTLTGVRHKLAHWTTSDWHPKGAAATLDKADKLQVRLVPSYLSAKNMNYRPKDAIHLKQVRHYCGQCEQLSQDLADLIFDLQRWLKEAENRGDVLMGKINGEDIGSGALIGQPAAS